MKKIQRNAEFRFVPSWEPFPFFSFLFFFIFSMLFSVLFLLCDGTRLSFQYPPRSCVSACIVLLFLYLCLLSVGINHARPPPQQRGWSVIFLQIPRSITHVSYPRPGRVVRRISTFIYRSLFLVEGASDRQKSRSFLIFAGFYFLRLAFHPYSGGWESRQVLLFLSFLFPLVNIFNIEAFWVSGS